jgi:hypothetical protein
MMKESTEILSNCELTWLVTKLTIRISFRAWIWNVYSLKNLYKCSGSSLVFWNIANWNVLEPRQLINSVFVAALFYWWKVDKIVIRKVSSAVRSQIKLNATVTFRLPAGTATAHVSWFYCLERYLTGIGMNLTALGCESCSSRREVTVAFKTISERTARVLHSVNIIFMTFVVLYSI